MATSSWYQAHSARDAAAARTTQLEADFEGFAELEARIAEAEDEAMALFEQAIQSFTTAARGVSADENLARAGQPSDPQRRPYHYGNLAGDQGWLKGQLAAQQAAAELLTGVGLIGQYQDAKANGGDLAADGDVDVVNRSGGGGEISTALHREGGNQEQNWECDLFR